MTSAAAAEEGSPRREARALRVACLALALLLLAFSAFYSRQAPLGDWQNQLLGESAWAESDPGSFYVAAAHELAFGEAPLFVGHPGSPLLLVLRAVQDACYALAGSRQLSFSEFGARNLPAIFLLSKLAMTLLQLASFAALYRFARVLGASESAACLALLGYATSLPALYYLSRISVEPILMLCFFAAFLALWRYEDLARAGRPRAALACAAAAALAALTGAVTKLNLLGPLPLLLCLAILVERRPASIPRRTRVLAASVFCAAAGAAALAWSQIIDWPRFVATWRAIGRPAPAATSGEAVLYCESAFAALGVIGAAGFWRRCPDRSRVVWPCVCAGLSLLPFGYGVALRGGFVRFHYLFVAVGVLAVFFGDASLRVLRGLSLPTRGPRGALVALAFAGLLHAASLVAVLDSRRHDAASYAPSRPLYEQIARLRRGERLGVEATRYTRPGFRAGLRSLHGIRVQRSQLRREFERLFAPVSSTSIPPGAPRLFAPALDAEIVLPLEAAAPAR